LSTKILNQTDSLNQKIIYRRSHPYKGLVDAFYETTVDFHYIEVDYVYKNVDLEIAFLLTLEAVFRVSSLLDLKAYTMDNPYVESLEYNIKNQILKAAQESLIKFIDSLNELAHKQKNEMIIYLIVCLVAYFSVVVLQLIFVILGNYSIFSQAEFMLLLHPKNCKKQEQVAKEFLAVIHLGTFDVEQMSDDDHSIDSGANSVRNDIRKKNYRISVSMRNMDGRKFLCSAFRKVGYLWRSLLFLCLLGGYLFTAFLICNARFNTIMDINEAYQLSIYFNGYLNGAHNALMAHYLTPEMPIYQMNTYDFILEKLTNLHKAANKLLDVHSLNQK